MYRINEKLRTTKKEELKRKKKKLSLHKTPDKGKEPDIDDVGGMTKYGVPPEDIDKNDGTR